jgi:hypothetical protein
LAQGSRARDEIRRELAGHLRDASNRVKDVHRQNDGRSLDYATRKADDISSALRKLDYAKGADREAARITSTWPAHVNAFKQAISKLKELKKWQFTLDNAVVRCEQAERELASFIRKYERNSDGIRAIPEKAKQLGAPLAEALKKASDHRRTMESLRNDAARFSSSDDAWRDVVRNVHDSARDTLGYWTGALDKAQRACGEIAKGESHRSVVAAVGALRRSSGSEIDQLERDVRAWTRDAREAYRVDCQGMEQVWEAYCGGDFERNEEPDKARASEVARNVERTMRARVDPLLTRLSSLEASVANMQAKSETKSKADALMRELAAEKPRLERLKRNGYRGSNHPLIQYAIEYGKQQHASMERRFSCDVADKPYPNAGGRPDCVNVSRCMVYEFKPNNQRARSQGNEQLGRYVPAVNRYYAQFLQGGAPSSELGGSSIMETIKRSCVRDGRVVFAGEVAPYNMCEKRYECVQ